MRKKKVLLINDFCGYGKVALSAMLPMMTCFNVSCSYLPTAVVSNTLDYGYFALDPLSDYMKESIKTWGELGLHFDAMTTGFFTDPQQVGLVEDYLNQPEQEKTVLFCDPIMGDNGAIYPGVSAEMIPAFRRLLGCSSIALPNYTEACVLTDHPYRREGSSKEELLELLEAIHELGAQSTILTSCHLGEQAVVAGRTKAGETFFLPYKEVKAAFPGTGDVFTSLIVGNYLQGASMKEACGEAVDFLSQQIARFQDQEDKLRGLPLDELVRAYRERKK